MQVSVAIPASITSDIPHLREKTNRVGMIGRALAIYRVDELIVYPDRPSEDQSRESELIMAILGYMETPQYLRKHLFPMMPELQYASILPPLRTPHHPLAKRIADLREGEYREGVVVRAGREAMVDIGVERPIPLNAGNASLGQRVTVKVSKDKSRVNLERVDKSEISGVYWGYRVAAPKQTLTQIMRNANFDIILLTSRYGKPITEIDEQLRSEWRKANKALIAFGSPKQGLREILQHEGTEIDNIGAFIINTVPNQGTETVRTEEAICATLAITNTFT